MLKNSHLIQLLKKIWYNESGLRIGGKMSKYTLISSELIRDKELSVNEKIILIDIITYHNKNKGYSFPTYEMLIKDTGVNKRTLMKSLDKLERLQYMKREPLEGSNRNKYIINEKYLIVKK